MDIVNNQNPNNKDMLNNYNNNEIINNFRNEKY